MDLSLYSRVLWRFRWLMLVGVILAGVLGVLTVARITPKGLVYRDNQLWQSTSTILLTQNGSTFADPGKYASLTDLYAQLANSDAVRRAMLRAGVNKHWTLTASPVPPQVNPSAVLPVIELTGQAFTPSQAIREVVTGRKAFLAYVAKQRGSARVTVLQNATKPELIKPRKKTLLIVVVLGILSATVGLAFVLENLRPMRPFATVSPHMAASHGPTPTRASTTSSNIPT